MSSLKEQHPSALHFSSSLITLPNKPLYPYHSQELAIIFVYGTDFKRQMNVWSMPGTVQEVAISIVLFMTLAAIILCVIRRKLKLSRNGFTSSIFDILIAFIAGGNLRVRNKFERWLFGILLIVTFFMTSIFTGHLLNFVYRVLNQKIDTFEQLPRTKLPAYIRPTLRIYTKQICEILRREINPHIIYKGIELSPPTTSSFIYVVEKFSIENFKDLFSKANRDFDVVPESLGAINIGFYLESEHYIPERMIKKIDKITSSIMGNGLYQFYASITAFKRKLLERSQMNHTDVAEQSLTMEQLRRPMILVCCLWGLALAFLAVEILIFKWNNRSKRNQHRK